MTRLAGAIHGLAFCLAAAYANAAAQPPPPPKSNDSNAPKARPAAATPQAAKSKDYRIGPRPSWVAEPPAATSALEGQKAASAGRRDLLVDQQSNYALPRPQSFVRFRSISTDASTLNAVSQLQIQFIPSYQSVTLHDVSVTRDGRRTDRLKDARIEMMRREQRLEQSMIDGVETLLVVPNDVRIGDTVEISYTVEGENPIFEGRISNLYQLAWGSPIEVLHLRIVAPVGRNLQTLAIGGAVTPERFTQGGMQVLRVVRSPVEAVKAEQATPPWFKVYPALHVSEYTQWTEVDAWGKRLFGGPANTGPEVAARAASFRASGLTSEALVSVVLKFVQDDIRYFSASLGESSHRPKPAERTLTERLGDCKDKVVLLNTLLALLGFDVKPALVSMKRNRGLVSYLPSHDQFDHVVTKLELNGAVYFLDPTISGQGLTLASRGYMPYGSALVIGEGAQLQVVDLPAAALNSLEFEQVWDFSALQTGATLKTIFRARGLPAEQVRNGLAQGNEQTLAEALAGPYMRVFPGLTRTGAPQFKDDRQTNVVELEQGFLQTNPSEYVAGVLEVEFLAMEMLDFLVGPPEARRSMPYVLDQTRLASSKVTIKAPRTFTMRLPAPVEVRDKHFEFIGRAEVSGSTLSYTARVQRRTDEVLPIDLDAYRTNIQRARQQLGMRVRLPLVDVATLNPEFERIDRRNRTSSGYRADRLSGILLRSEVSRLLDTQALMAVESKGPLAARILTARAESNNLLADFAIGLADAEAALLIDQNAEAAIEARAVSLIGLARLDEAFADLTRLSKTNRRATALKWMGSIELLRGHHAESEKYLREVVSIGGPDDREFGVLWLYVAAEYQGGRGRSAVAQYVENSDPTKLTGAMLRYFDGRIDRDALIRLAKDKPEMERLNLAEVYFFIGQQLAAQGRRDEALKWFSRTVETGAIPYREVTFARFELKRGS